MLTVNVVLLGGNIGFFQSMCLLGYCLFPMDVAAIVTACTTNMIARWIVVLVRRASLAQFPQSCSAHTSYMYSVPSDTIRYLRAIPASRMFLHSHGMPEQSCQPSRCSREQWCAMSMACTLPGMHPEECIYAIGIKMRVASTRLPASTPVCCGSQAA